MNLPHGDMLLYVKEVLSRNDNEVEVKCIFDNFPSLAMFIEAAAQSSSAFDEDAKIEMAFLTMAKEIELWDEIKEKEYIFKLKKEAEIGGYKQFSFNAIGKRMKVKVVSGSFTIVVLTFGVE